MLEYGKAADINKAWKSRSMQIQAQQWDSKQAAEEIDVMRSLMNERLAEVTLKNTWTQTGRNLK